MRSMGNEDTMAASGWATGLKLASRREQVFASCAGYTLYGIDVCESRCTAYSLHKSNVFVSRSRVILLRIDIIIYSYLSNYRVIRKFGHRNYSYEINSLRLFYVDNLLLYVYFM